MGLVLVQEQVVLNQLKEFSFFGESSDDEEKSKNYKLVRCIFPLYGVCKFGKQHII